MLCSSQVILFLVYTKDYYINIVFTTGHPICSICKGLLYHSPYGWQCALNVTKVGMLCQHSLLPCVVKCDSYVQVDKPHQEKLWVGCSYKQLISTFNNPVRSWYYKCTSNCFTDFVPKGFGLDLLIDFAAQATSKGSITDAGTAGGPGGAVTGHEFKELAVDDVDVMVPFWALYGL